MNKYEQLEVAIRIAVEAHSGQFDKSGKPYILHPLHLMRKLLFDPELAAIAVSHDVVEDTKITIQYYIDNDFSRRFTNALTILTHEKGVPYADYIDEICGNYDAIRVKCKDLEHNSQITRLKGVGEKDLARIEKYHLAFIKLGKARSVFLR